MALLTSGRRPNCSKDPIFISLSLSIVLWLYESGVNVACIFRAWNKGFSSLFAFPSFAGILTLSGIGGCIDLSALTTFAWLTDERFRSSTRGRDLVRPPNRASVWFMPPNGPEEVDFTLFLASTGNRATSLERDIR